MSLTRWVFRKENEQKVEEFKAKFGLGDLVARVLSARNLTCDQYQNIFSCENIEDPFVLKDMEKAVDRINNAVKNNEKIAIYGDYDCDGICATAMLYKYLISMGANVIEYIPERAQGYGLSNSAIDYLKKQSVNLIITVDNGIVAFDEASYIKKCNIDLIITDHHHATDTLPEAVAVVNPKRLDDNSIFKDICGAVVVLKLIAALENGNYDKAFNFAGDLAAIATIGDVMPLIKENRLIVKKGLELIKFTKNYGLQYLIKLSSLSNHLSSGTIAFGICPRINATGRLGNAKLSFELLTCEDEQEAKKLADTVFGYNMKRQKIESEIINEIQSYISKNHKELYKPVLVISNENWPKGLIGIIAGKLMDLYSKPAIILSIDGETAVGSARSFEGFSMYDALDYCKEYFIKWGGHDLAGGLTIPTNKIEIFKQKINEYAIKHQPPYRTKNIDLVIDPSKINVDMVDDLKVLGPFGQSNIQPIFMINNAKLVDIVPLSDHKHLRLKFLTQSTSINVVYFNMPLSHFYYKVGNLFNILVNIEINHYQGLARINYKMLDIRPIEVNQTKMIAASMEFDRIIKNKKISTAIKHIIYPTHKEFSAVYKLIKKLKVFHGNAYKLYTLICTSSINYCKLCIILEVLSTEGLIKFTPNGIECINNPPRTNLNSNPLIKQLRSDI